MIERLQGTVEKITRVERVGDSLDLCEIQIGFDDLKIFYDYNDLLDYLNCEVQYTTRKDVVRGVPDLVVCELVKLSTIQTVAASENIRLIPEGNKRTLCNFDVQAARFGNFYPNVCALMSSYELGTSPKARWFDCTMIDMYSRIFVVRKFEPEGDLDVLEKEYQGIVGKYVVFDLESTKYGYQTKEITSLQQSVELSPEVIVARKILEDEVAKDEAIAAYVKAFDMLNVLAEKMDGEPGYNLVRMASEIYMINAIENISTDLDIRAMRRAVFCSRGYVLPHKTEWSIPLLNNSKVMQIPALKTDRELMLIIDVLSREQMSPTKATYIKIRGLVNDIINIRRGIEDEKDVTSTNALTSLFNGLL